MAVWLPRLAWRPADLQLPARAWGEMGRGLGPAGPQVDDHEVMGSMGHLIGKYASHVVCPLQAKAQPQEELLETRDGEGEMAGWASDLGAGDGSSFEPRRSWGARDAQLGPLRGG